MLLPPGPGMLQTNAGGGGGGVAYPQQGMGGGMGGYGPPPGVPAGGPGFAPGGWQQQQGRQGMPPGGGYGYAPPGMPGGGYAQGGPPGQGGYSSGGRMQGIAGPNVRTLGTVASAAPSGAKMHLFQKTLRDMITGMRQHKNPADQQRFLHKCMAEMRDEVRHGTQLARLSGSAASQPPRACRARRPRPWRCGCRLPRRVRPSGATLSRPPFRGLPQVKSTDLRTKALALEKMAYLHMLGYDMSWAAFHVVEARAAAAQRSARSNPNRVAPCARNARRS